MIRVYVAGALNSDAVGYIKNAHRMIKTARELRKYGFSVYVPANDFLEGIVDGSFEYTDYFNNGQEWLKVSQAMFLTPGWESSMGTLREIEVAASLEIPTFKDIDKLIRHFDIN